MTFPTQARSWISTAVALVCAGLAPAAGATTIGLSTASSDATPASVLDATFTFMITGASELTLTVSNDTTAPNMYNINGVWFNAAAHVTSLALVSATHSAEGNVSAGWSPLLTNDPVAGFGTFDFGLIDGVGEGNPNIIGPGEIVTFVFTISGTGPYDMADFLALTQNGYAAAAKFVNGPAANDLTESLEDSAFGAAVPEPASAALLAAGLLGIGTARRRRR